MDTLCELILKTREFRLTGMQTAALVARADTPTHREAAERMGISLNAFCWRFARAMCRFPYQIRNEIRSKFPKKPKRPRLGRRPRSLISNFGDA